MLNGLKVLDFGSALAAPYAAMLLADLGAEVIKIEKPLRGDLIRYTDEYISGQSGYFLGMNRGKRSVTLDLRVPQGRDIALQMCREADVVVENFRPGMMDKWGLSYEDVKAVQPNIIYCSVSAFAEARGFEGRSGNDIVAQAYSGLMAMTGRAEEAPSKAGAPVIDVATACMATISILAGLVRRMTTGQGARIETSLIEAGHALMPNFTASVLNGSPQFRRLGSGHPQLVPYESYPTKDDQFVVVGAFHQESWRRFCRAIEREDLLEVPEFENNALRVRHRDQINAIVTAELRKHTLAYWVETFEREDVPVSPVLEIEESLEFFAARNPDAVADDVESYAGKIRMLKAPFRIDGSRPYSRLGVPGLGSSTDDVLAELGYSNEERNELRAQRII
ncbi:CaiB/BaiF CoA-transferase family protein [Diaminobutyricimonas sp. LJ205]|uniref:CaiB/BaiF CoA transferase family protein n=1 Tax=Diaminobutyricimonas sp. LJ205 TaxID=2683590 RepID=UPI0012F5007A|nr:CaiB/BaiF CoA-transferase family protein [Diaminobutyricimonas sp. LJ205]